jgi:hypothetical protein
MGGGNAQKSAAARERNMKNVGKTDAERKEASAKATKDAHAFVCKLCKQTFMVNATPEILYLHVTTKHSGNVPAPTACFDKLADFDPSDPTGEIAAKAARADAAAVLAKKEAAAAKKKKAAEGDVFSMLDAGLSKGKGKKNKFGK